MYKPKQTHTNALRESAVDSQAAQIPTIPAAPAEHAVPPLPWAHDEHHGRGGSYVYDPATKQRVRAPDAAPIDAPAALTNEGE